MTRVCIVGNAPLITDHSAQVDACDQVIRFNQPAEWRRHAGERFDTWVLAGGRTGRKFARAKAFIDAPYRDLPRDIWIAHDPSVNAEINARHGTREFFGIKDHSRFMKTANNLPQPITRFRPPIYNKCLKLLGNPHHATAPQIPSSGFMTLHYVMKHQPDAEIIMVGFGFEGGPKHPWAAEKSVIQDLAAQGRLTLLPL